MPFAVRQQLQARSLSQRPDRPVSTVRAARYRAPQNHAGGGCDECERHIRVVTLRVGCPTVMALCPIIDVICGYKLAPVELAIRLEVLAIRRQAERTVVPCAELLHSYALRWSSSSRRSQVAARPPTLVHSKLRVDTSSLSMSALSRSKAMRSSSRASMKGIISTSFPTRHVTRGGPCTSPPASCANPWGSPTAW